MSSPADLDITRHYAVNNGDNNSSVFNNSEAPETRNGAAVLTQKPNNNGIVFVRREHNGYRRAAKALATNNVNAAALAAGTTASMSVPHAAYRRSVTGDTSRFTRSSPLSSLRGTILKNRWKNGDGQAMPSGGMFYPQDTPSTKGAKCHGRDASSVMLPPQLESSENIPPNASFTASYNRALNLTRQQERWKLTLEHTWFSIKIASLFMYVGVLLGVAVYETSRAEAHHVTLYIFFAFVFYVVLIMIVWILLMIILLRRRMFRHFVASWWSPTHYSPAYTVVRSPRATSTHVPSAHQLAPVFSIKAIGTKLRRMCRRREQILPPNKVPSFSAYPDCQRQSTSSQASCTAHDNGTNAMYTQSGYAEEDEQATHGAPEDFGGKKHYNVRLSEPFELRRQSAKNANNTPESSQPHSAMPLSSVRRSASELNWLYYCWRSEKQRMRRGELQYLPHYPMGFSRNKRAFTTNAAALNRRTTHREPSASRVTIGASNRNGSPTSQLQSQPLASQNENALLDGGDRITIHPYISCPNLCSRSSCPPLSGDRRTSASHNVINHGRASTVFTPPLHTPFVKRTTATVLKWAIPKGDSRPSRCYLCLAHLRHPVKFFCSVNWLKVFFQTTVTIHTFPAFQVAVLLRNFAWCGLYIWATTLIFRSTSSEPWDTSRMPRIFWRFEEVFMWMITWDYIIALLATPDAFGFIFSFPSLIDLATMPTAKTVTRLLFKDAAIKYSIHFGSLRILRLVRIEGILSQVVPWMGQVKLRLISLVIGAFVITLMFASAMFILEAPYQGREGYKTLYDFLFFAVVTISTVGYGDFAPSKPASKAIVMVAIVVALAFLPTQIQKLVAALQSPPNVIGRLPTENQDYIVISGPVDPRQLTFICRELSLSLQGSVTFILVITPHSVVEYSTVIRSAFLRGRIHVAVLRLDLASLKLRTYYRGARAVLIVGNVDPQESSVMTASSIITRDADTALLEDDHNTLLRFQGAQHICWPDKPICVQLNDGTARHLVTEMGAYHVVCLQHIKMKLMAKSCAGCPGFSTLITNLFYQPLKDLDLLLNEVAANDPMSEEAVNMRLYLRGARYQLYRLEFPECFYGLPFSLLFRLLVARYEAYFLGVCCVTKEYWLNPIGYCVGDERSRSFTDWPFAGVVAAASLRIVQKISALKSLDITQEHIAVENWAVEKKNRGRNNCIRAYNEACERGRLCETGRSDGQKFRGFYASHTRESNVLSPNAPTTVDSFYSSPLGFQAFCQLPKFSNSSRQNASYLNQQGSSGQLKLKRSFREKKIDNSDPLLFVPEMSPLGLVIVPDVQIAKRFVFKTPESDLIVLCGWPRGIPVFLATVLKSVQANIVILAPYHPSGLSTGVLHPFADACVWVKGSGLDVMDLLRAGILEARSCAVFSSPHASWKQNFSTTKTDTQAVLVRRFVYALHNSDALLETRLQFASSQCNIAYHSSSLGPPRSEETASSSVGSPLPYAGNDNGRSVKYDDAITPETQSPNNDFDAHERKTATTFGSSPPCAPEESETEEDSSLSPLMPAASLVIMELHSNQYIEFLDTTPLGSITGATSNASMAGSPAGGAWQRDYDLLWAQEGISAANPEYTSGRVLLEQMLYGIISFSLPVSRCCVDSRIIDQLVDGLHVPLPDGVPHTCPTWLEPVPLSHETATFGDFLDFYLKEHLKLVFAVYRCTRKLSPKRTPLDLLQGNDAFQYVVISCPPLEMPLQKGDLVYVLQPCPIEALGLLLAADRHR